MNREKKHSTKDIGVDKKPGYLSRFLEAQSQQAIWEWVIKPLLSFLFGVIGFYWGKRAEIFSWLYSIADIIESPDTIKAIIGFVVPVLGFGVIAWFILSGIVSVIRKFRTAAKKNQVQQTDVTPKATNDEPILTKTDRFSSHLDKSIENLRKRNPQFRISGNGRTFIEAIKDAPPFIGESFEQVDPVIYPDAEKTLTQYFEALRFVEENDEIIRGGNTYYAKPDQTTFEQIAQDVYGDTKFADQVRQSNIGGDPPSTGQTIILPYIDVTGKLGLPSEYIKKQYHIANTPKWIYPVLRDLIDANWFVDELEASFLLLAVYDAAQQTLEDVENEQIKHKKKEQRAKKRKS